MIERPENVVRHRGSLTCCFLSFSARRSSAFGEHEARKDLSSLNTVARGCCGARRGTFLGSQPRLDVVLDKRCQGINIR
jgi:hypothetical protein